jgi:hypothetical protein
MQKLSYHLPLQSHYLQNRSSDPARPKPSIDKIPYIPVVYIAYQVFLKLLA